MTALLLLMKTLDPDRVRSGTINLVGISLALRSLSSARDIVEMAIFSSNMKLNG